MGVATNIVAAQPTLSSIVSNSSHCHPDNSIFDTNILHHAICPSLCRYDLVTKKIASTCIDYIIACAAVPRPWTGCCHEIKITKINFEGVFGPSTKITHHTVS